MAESSNPDLHTVQEPLSWTKKKNDHESWIMKTRIMWYRRLYSMILLIRFWYSRKSRALAKLLHWIKQLDSSISQDSASRWGFFCPGKCHLSGIDIPITSLWICTPGSIKLTNKIIHHTYSQQSLLGQCPKMTNPWQTRTHWRKLFHSLPVLIEHLRRASLSRLQYETSFALTTTK